MALAKAECKISQKVMEEFQNYIYVKMDKVKGEGKVYIGSIFFFREENLEKI